MSDDERPESLAQQAASWVPPWERQPRPPDRRFQAEAEATARATAGDELDAQFDLADETDLAGESDFAEAEESAAVDDLVDDDDAVVDEISADASDEPAEEERPDDDEDRSEAGLSDDDDDFDEAFEGTNPPGYFEHETGKSEMSGESEAPEEPALTGDADETLSVDQPVGDAVDDVGPEPSVGEVGPELPVPDVVEDAVEALDDEGGAPADAPIVEDRADDDAPADDAPADDAPADDAPAAERQAESESVGVGLPAAESVPAVPGAAAVPEQGRRKHDVLAVGGASTRTSEELLDLADDDELCAALEAILLVVDEPVAEMQLAQILEQPTERVGVMLENISARYTAAGHGFDLRRAAGGWRLYTRPEYADYVERFVLDGQSVRLTQAALETLAVVAYKQPVTRSRISAIRGVNCDGVMRTLATRGLIEECGVEGETGAYLYRTTPLFLEKLGINSVDQLPPLAPFLPDDVEEVLDAPG